MTVTAPLRTAPIHVSDEVLDDLRHRLHTTRWPVDASNEDRSYGVDRATLERLTDYWRDDYDWRTAERRINRYEHWFVEIDGVPIHFMRVRGTASNPTPLILTHGWPWTFWHWSKVVDALATPITPDGPTDGFDVIVPSFPGFGFSSPLLHSDMSFTRVADLWHELMTDVLGFDRYVAGGCDVGALATGALGHRYPHELIAIHIGSGQKLTLFEGDRAWDVSGGQPIPADLEP
jgi:microsomal epoxide hydrolase